MQNTQKWSPALMQSENSDITTWELPDGAIARLGQGGMSDMAYSPDGKHFVFGSTIGVWWYDISTMSPIALWDTERGFISAVSFSPNGRWLATGDGDRLVKVWDVQRGVCISQMDRDEDEKPYHTVSHLVFSADSQFLAVSSKRDYTLYVYHPETGERLAKFHDDPKKSRRRSRTLRPIAFSADGTLLACTMPDERLRGHADRGGDIRLPKDSTEFIAVWNIETGEQLACLTDTERLVCSLCFSLCGRFLASGGRDGAVQVWSVENWELLHTFQNLGTERKKVFYSPEGLLYALEMSDDALIVWNIARGEKCNHYLEEHSSLHDAHVAIRQPRTLMEIAFSPCGNLIAGGLCGELRLWNAETLTTLFEIPQPQRQNPYALAFSPCGKYLASGTWWEKGMEKMAIRLWEVATGENIATLWGHPTDIQSLAFSPDGTLLASGSFECTTLLWDLKPYL